MVVEPGKVREFARAVRIDLSELQDDSGAMSIPATFLTVLQFVEDPVQVAEDLGFELGRTLHGEQEFVFHGPPPVAGTTLWATSAVTRRYEKSGRRGGVMRFAVRSTEFRSEDGALVATAEMTAIETAAAVDAS
ncbi:dehydratase [Nakamurella sp. YIM 132087]|uniref:Dehydratase n=1 Tax=Nakamurella alba TaxID=2665158 RepID=A0A7K1FHS6_9ACTN|nr:dehydratase [Nakamurella alba]